MNNHYKIVCKVAAVIFLLASFSACKKDFFEMEDRNGMDSRIWDNEAAIQFLLNDTYDVVMPDYPYEVAANNVLYSSDEDRLSAADGTMKKALGLSGALVANDIKYIATKYQGTKGDNKYFDIARCNTAIEGISTGNLPLLVKNKLKGQFYALRAMTYFDLTRLYGGVPLVLSPQNPDHLQLMGRAKAADCFKSIVSDLDSAIVLLNGVTWNDASERGKWTKKAAAALKGKALLYWASPQFNPTNDALHPYDANRWQTAYQACKEAYEICLASGASLLPNYAEIFLKEGGNNPEALIVRSYSSKLAKRGQNVESKLRPVEEGGAASAFTPTLNLVRQYGMKDGMPTSNPSASSPFNPTLFWLNRDPRFEATIAYNGSNWKLSGKSGRRQWNYQNAVNEGNKVMGFYLKKFSDPELAKTSVAYANDYGGNGLDWIEMRFAEVILNYAECANEIGDLGAAKELVKAIRVRAGIVPGAQNYGLGLANSKSDMRELMNNERTIEFAFEGKRFHDLRRTRRMHLLEGNIELMIWETKTKELRDFLEAVNTDGLRNRDTLNVNNEETFKRFFNTSVGIVSGTGSFTVPEYYYFFALPSTFMNSSPLLDQTIGWDGGTFDPL